MNQPTPEVIWAPFEGFQTSVLAAADGELLIGGAKGSGKSDLLLIKPLRWVDRPAFAGAIVRQHYTDLKRVIDRARSIYSRLGPASARPVWNGEQKRYTWPSGAFIQFGHARRTEDLSWTQGGNWAYIAYDEIGNQPDERVADTLLAELRCPDPSIVRQFVGSANPGFAGHSWVKRRYVVPCGKEGGRVVAHVPLADGRVVALSRRFIPGRVTDNPILRDDPTYMAQLQQLPERMRRCLLDGDWDAATGSAFEELDAGVHLVAPYEPPRHWRPVAAFDWGFAHWWVFMYGVVDEDGRIVILDTIRGRRMREWDIAGRILERVPERFLRVVHAGHDCWAEHQARGDRTPTLAAYFDAQGIGLTRANIARAQGYLEVCRRLAWRETEYMPRRQPALTFMDTPGNRWLVEEHLPAIVMDPDNPADVLKVDADADTGAGGDDGYDVVRYLCASNPMAAIGGPPVRVTSAWSPDVLRHQAHLSQVPDLPAAPTARVGRVQRRGGGTPYLGV